jgi:hypothetical protein
VVQASVKSRRFSKSVPTFFFSFCTRISLPRAAGSYADLVRVQPPLRGWSQSFPASKRGPVGQSRTSANTEISLACARKCARGTGGVGWIPSAIAATTGPVRNFSYPQNREFGRARYIFGAPFSFGCLRP